MIKNSTSFVVSKKNFWSFVCTSLAFSSLAAWAADKKIYTCEQIKDGEAFGIVWKADKSLTLQVLGKEISVQVLNAQLLPYENGVRFKMEYKVESETYTDSVVSITENHQRSFLVSGELGSQTDCLSGSHFDLEAAKEFVAQFSH